MITINAIKMLDIALEFEVVTLETTFKIASISFLVTGFIMLNIKGSEKINKYQ